MAARRWAGLAPARPAPLTDAVIAALSPAMRTAYEREVSEYTSWVQKQAQWDAATKVLKDPVDETAEIQLNGKSVPNPSKLKPPAIQIYFERTHRCSR